MAVSCSLIASFCVSIAFGKPQPDRKLISSMVAGKGKTKTIVFPKKGVGSYYVDTPEPIFLDSVRHIPEAKTAKGNVTVREGAFVELEPGYATQSDLRILKQIKPDDIQGLSLQGVWVTNDIIRNACWLNKITLLDVGGTFTTDQQLEMILKVNPQLKWLSSSITPNLTDKALDAIVTMRDLQKLEIARDKFSEAGLHKLAAMKNLKFLDLSFSNADDRTLAVLATMPSLTTLNLTSTKITDKGLAALAQSRSLKNLAIEKTSVSDVGLKDGLSKMPQLEELDVSGTKVTDRGIGFLESNANLRKLWVRETSVTPAVIPVLQRHAKLENLEVQKTKWTSLDTYKIGQLMPKLHAHAQKQCSCKKYKRIN